MTVSYNKTATSFEELKTRLKNEFSRRNKNGSLTDSTDFSLQAITNNTVNGGVGAELIDRALSIEDISGLALVLPGDLLPDLSSLSTSLSKWESESLDSASTSCRGYCTGLCKGACATGCTGCGNNCTQSCGESCGSGCVKTCTTTCGNSCQNQCGGSCTGGCDGCSTGCMTACTGCSSTSS